jgi:hypothetical protein
MKKRKEQKGNSMAFKQNDDTVGEEVSAFGQRVKGVTWNAKANATGSKGVLARRRTMRWETTTTFVHGLRGSGLTT